MKKYKWVVEFEVDETWVEDGFDLDDERAQNMIQNDLRFATSSEVNARAIKSPPAKEIRKAQGYNAA